MLWINRKDTLAKISAFLWQKIGTDLIREVAKNELNEIKQLNGQLPASGAEIDDYIEHHYKDLKSKTAKTIQVLAEKMLAESKAKALLKDLGVMTLLFVAPMYPIGSYLMLLLGNGKQDLGEIGGCIVSLVLLSLPLLAFFISLFQRHR